MVWDISLSSLVSWFSDQPQVCKTIALNNNSKSNLIHEANFLCQRIQYKIKGNNELLSNVKEIHCSLRDIGSWAHLYDYSYVQANGYWTLIRVAIHFLKLVLKKHAKSGIDKDLISLSTFIRLQLQCAKKIRQESLRYQEDDDPPLCVPSLDLSADLLYTFYDDAKDPMLYSLYGKYFGFYMPKWIRILFHFIHSFALLLSGYFIDFIRSFISPTYKGVALFRNFKYLKSDDLLKLLYWPTILLNPFLSKILPFFWCGVLHPDTRRNVSVPRQNKWAINMQTFKVERIFNGYPINSDTINCLVLMDRSSFDYGKEANIILNFHGGAYMSLDPSFNEIYLREWVNKISNAVVISVEYTLAPSGQFPVALQEALHVYLWLTSGRKDVENKLGVKPGKIILTGDSAGGNIAASLCLLVNDIKKIIESGSVKADIKMPHAMLCLYTPFIISPYSFPSILMIGLDALIAAPLYMVTGDVYIPRKSCKFTKSNKTAIKSIDQDTNNNSINPLSFFGKISQPKSKAWFDVTKPEFLSLIKEIEEAGECPYLSLTKYDDFESLSNVRLHMIISHYDPLLDTNVVMAKKWKGPVTFDVIDHFPHGFLNFLSLSSDIRKANSVCIQRMIDSFNFS